MINAKNLKPVTPMDMQSMYGTVPEPSILEDVLKKVNPELTEFMVKLFGEMLTNNIKPRLNYEPYWPWDL